MILEAIFRGNFTPLDLIVPDDPNYKKLNLEVSALRDQLAEKLSQDDRMLLDTMIQDIYTTQLMETEAYFTFAFSAGLHLQKEAADKIHAVLREQP